MADPIQSLKLPEWKEGAIVRINTPTGSISAGLMIHLFPNKAEEEINGQGAGISLNYRAGNIVQVQAAFANDGVTKTWFASVQPTSQGSGILGGSDAADKISFYGVNMIVQPNAMPAAGSDAGTVQTLVNYLRQEILNLGLMK